MEFLKEEMFYLFLWVVQASLFGGVTLWIGKSKGYKGVKGALWFFDGFFFLIYGIIIAIRRPDFHDEFLEDLHCSPFFREEWEQEKKDKEREKQEKEKFLTVNGGWICCFCGNKNYGYVGTCACGKTKQESAV